MSTKPTIGTLQLMDKDGMWHEYQITGVTFGSGGIEGTLPERTLFDWTADQWEKAYSHYNKLQEASLVLDFFGVLQKREADEREKEMLRVQRYWRRSVTMCKE